MRRKHTCQYLYEPASNSGPTKHEQLLQNGPRRIVRVPVSTGSVSVFHSLTRSTRYQGQDCHYPQCEAGRNTVLMTRLFAWDTGAQVPTQRREPRAQGDSSRSVQPSGPHQSVPGRPGAPGGRQTVRACNKPGNI